MNKQFNLKTCFVIIIVMVVIQLIIDGLVVVPTELLARMHYLERSKHFILVSLKSLGWVLPFVLFFSYAFMERKLSLKYKIFIWIFWFLISIALPFLIFKLDNNSFIGYCNEALEKYRYSGGLINLGPCFMSGLYFGGLTLIYIFLDFILVVWNFFVFLYKWLRKNIINYNKNKDLILK